MAAPLAALLPNGKQQFFNASGAPLSGGFVYMYIPNTTTPKTTWQDPLEAIPNANPITLDGGGFATIYGSGQYTQTVTDSLANLVYSGLTQDAISLNTANFLYGGTSSGSANAQTVTVSSLVGGTLTTGQPIGFIAGFTNTSSMTLNVSSIGNKNVFKQSLVGPVALTGGEIQANMLVIVIYDGAEFQIVAMHSNFASLNVAESFTAGKRGAIVTVTPVSNTVTIDFNLGNNFAVAMQGNYTLANPLNQIGGQSGQITLTQDSTGSRTLAYAGNWKFAGGSAPTLTTTSNAVDILAYFSQSSNAVTANALLNVR